MDMIVKQLVDQLGLDEAIARQAVVIVIGVVKDNLPAPIAGRLEGLLEGESMDAGDSAGGIMGAISGLFGNK